MTCWLAVALGVSCAVGQPLANRVDTHAVLSGVRSEINPAGFDRLGDVMPAGDGSYWVIGTASQLEWLGDDRGGNYLGYEGLWYVSPRARDGSALAHRTMLARALAPRRFVYIFPLLVLRDGSLLALCDVRRYDERDGPVDGPGATYGQLVRFTPEGGVVLGDAPVQGAADGRAIEDRTGVVHVFTSYMRYGHYYTIEIGPKRLHVSCLATVRGYRNVLPGHHWWIYARQRAALALADSGHIVVAASTGLADTTCSIYRIRLPDLALVDSCRVRVGSDETYEYPGTGLDVMKLVRDSGGYWLFASSQADRSPSAKQRTYVYRITSDLRVVRPSIARRFDSLPPLADGPVGEVAVHAIYDLGDQPCAPPTQHMAGKLDLEFLGYGTDGMLYSSREHAELPITIPMSTGHER